MSCFFCASSNHVSHNCDVYESDESRQQIAASKNQCPRCLALLKTSYSLKTICNCKLQCFICFAKGHHSVYCPKRSTAFCSTILSIDNDLLWRFVKLLQFEEKYALALANPSIFHCANLKPLKVYYQKELIFPTYIKFTNADLVVTEYIFINDHVLGCLRKELTNTLSTQIFYIRHLDIIATEFSSKELLLLLSSKTMILKCGSTKFIPNLQFSNIIKKAPKLEEINISLTNIVINKSWPADLVQFNTADALQSLYIQIVDVYFDVEGLADLFKKESAINLKIYLYMHNSYNLDAKQSFENLKIQISKYFIPKKFPVGQSLQLYSFQDGRNFGDFEEYVLKNL